MSTPPIATSPSLVRRVKPVLQFASDAIVAAFALVIAYLIRYEFQAPSEQYVQIGWILLPLVAALKPTLNLLLGSYRQMWIYTSLREVGVLLATTVIVAALFLGLRLSGILGIPYSIILLDATFFFGGAVGIRAVRRLQAAHTRRTPEPAGAMRTLIVGAGETGNYIVRDATQARLPLVGILDDDPAKLGRRLNGVPVLGPTTDLERVVREREVERVVIAIPTADVAVVRDLIRRAESAGAVVRVAPGVRSSILGNPMPRTVAPTLDDLVDADEVKNTLLNRISPDRVARVLVTGGAGYIGNFLVRRLLDAGHIVRVLDNFTFGDSALDDLRDHPNLEVREGDVANLRDVSSAVKDCGTVIALAAIVGDPACGVDAEETLALNYEATKAITEACSFYGVDRLVFASSCSVYGASEGEEMLDETSPLNPVSLYARTRILSEDVVFERCGSTTPVVLRLATVFGLSRRMRFDLVVNTLTVRGVVDGAFQVFGGEQWRPFVHCSDVADAFFLAATAPTERVAGQVFNVGSDAMNYTISDVGEVVASEIRKSGRTVDAQNVGTIDDARNYRVTFNKIRKALRFEPRFDLETGIREMIDAIGEDETLQAYRDLNYSNVAVMRERLQPTGDGAVVPAEIEA